MNRNIFGITMFGIHWCFGDLGGMYDGGNLHDLGHSRRFGEHPESMETLIESGYVAFIGERNGLAVLLRCLVLLYIIISLVFLFYLFDAKDTDRWSWVKGNMTNADIAEKDVTKRFITPRTTKICSSQPRFE